MTIAGSFARKSVDTINNFSVQYKHIIAESLFLNDNSWLLCKGVMTQPTARKLQCGGESGNNTDQNGGRYLILGA